VRINTKAVSSKAEEVVQEGQEAGAEGSKAAEVKK